ncbi:hypothetical protein T4D_5039 [Trichinella pseudospiralis]|uniref:Uncharacterized protein n=1 Tax=Trichinella pseudospiralis TaxID=6337 RepID=A0A0V1FDY5_TRIPS|nr:hypothetical protein T4D_5039 [Trichinella pseudospiralis]
MHTCMHVLLMSSFYNISEIDAFKASACRRLIITVGRVALRQAFEDVSAQLGRALSTLINSPEVSVKWQFSKLNRRENTHICKRRQALKWPIEKEHAPSRCGKLKLTAKVAKEVPAIRKATATAPCLFSSQIQRHRHRHALEEKCVHSLSTNDKSSLPIGRTGCEQMAPVVPVSPAKKNKPPQTMLETLAGVGLTPQRGSFKLPRSHQS